MAKREFGMAGTNIASCRRLFFHITVHHPPPAVSNSNCKYIKK
jgi:hypothetical protein